MTISKSRSRCQTPVRNVKRPPNVPKEDSKDKEVLYTFDIKITKKLIMCILKTSDHIQIKIKVKNPSQEHAANSKFANKDLRPWMFIAPSKSK